MDIIRYSTEKDLPAVKDLMQRVFGDSDDFIHLLFRFLYKDNVLLYWSQEKIVSMAFLLPAVMRMQGKLFPMTYLYACATAPEYRGKGLMKQIIDRAFQDACEKEELGLFLLPAEESLYRYYETLGFRNFFYQNEEFYSQDITPCDDHKKDDLPTLEPIRAEEYHLLRSGFLPEEFAVHYPVSHFCLVEKSAENFPFYKIMIEKKLKGVCFVEKKGSLLNVKELLATDLSPERISRTLFHYFNMQNVKIMTPGKARKSAMIKLCHHQEALVNQTGYFSFGLD